MTRIHLPHVTPLKLPNSDIARPNEGIFDATCIKCLLECPFKYYLHYIEGLRAAPSMALLFGTYFHDMLNSWYTTKDREQALSVWATYPETGDRLRTRINGKLWSEDYFTHWGDDPQWAVVETEIAFVLPVEDGLYAGRIDLLVSQEDGLVVVDHKTTSELGARFNKKWKPSTQLDGYAYAIYMHRESVPRVCVNAICTAAYERRPKGDRFARDISDRDMQDIEVWRGNIDRLIALEHWCREYGFFKNMEACSNWGGCEYHDICEYHIEKSQWHKMFETREEEVDAEH